MGPAALQRLGSAGLLLLLALLLLASRPCSASVIGRGIRDDGCPHDSEACPEFGLGSVSLDSLVCDHAKNVILVTVGLTDNPNLKAPSWLSPQRLLSVQVDRNMADGSMAVRVSPRRNDDGAVTLATDSCKRFKVKKVFDLSANAPPKPLAGLSDLLVSSRCDTHGVFAKPGHALIVSERPFAGGALSLGEGTAVLPVPEGSNVSVPACFQRSGRTFPESALLVADPDVSVPCELGRQPLGCPICPPPSLTQALKERICTSPSAFIVRRNAERFSVHDRRKPWFLPKLEISQTMPARTRGSFNIRVQERSRVGSNGSGSANCVRGTFSIIDDVSPRGIDTTASRINFIMSSQCSCQFLRKDAGYAVLLHSRPIPKSGRGVYLDESFTLFSLPAGVTNIPSCDTDGTEPMLADQPVQDPTQQLLQPDLEHSCPVCHSSLEPHLYDPVCGAHTVVRLLSLNPAVKGPSGAYRGKTRIAQIVRGKQDGVGDTLLYTMPDNCNCHYVTKPSRQYFVFMRGPLQSSENKVTHVAFTNQIHILAYSYRNSRFLQDAMSACPTNGTEVPPVADHRMDTYEAADQAVYGGSLRVPSGPLHETSYDYARHGASQARYKAHDAGRSAYPTYDSSGYGPKPANPSYNAVTSASHDGASVYSPSPLSGHAFPEASAGYSAPATAYAASSAPNYGSAPSTPDHNVAAASYGASAVTVGYVGNSASYSATLSPTYSGYDSVSGAPSYGGATAYGPSLSHAAASSPTYGGYNAASVAPAYAGAPYGPSPNYGSTSSPTQVGYDSSHGARGYSGAPAYGSSTSYGATSSPYGSHNSASAATGYRGDPAYGPATSYAAPSSVQPVTYATPSEISYAAASSGSYGATPHSAGAAPSYGYAPAVAGYAPAAVPHYGNVPASAYSAPAEHSSYGAAAQLGYDSGSVHKNGPSYPHAANPAYNTANHEARRGKSYKPATATSHGPAPAGNYVSTGADKYNAAVATYAPNYAGSPAAPRYGPMKQQDHVGGAGYGSSGSSYGSKPQSGATAGASGYTQVVGSSAGGSRHSQPAYRAAPGGYNAAPPKGHSSYSPAGYSAVAHSSLNYGTAPASVPASSSGGAHYSSPTYGAPPPSYGNSASKSYGTGSVAGYGSAASPGYKTASATSSGSGYPASYNNVASSGVHNLPPAGYNAGHGNSAPSSAHASMPTYGAQSYGTSAGQNYQPTNGGGASSGPYGDVTYVPPYVVPDYSPAYYEPLYPSEDEYAPVISYVPTYPPEEEYSVSTQSSYNLGGGYGGSGVTYAPPAYAAPAYGQAYAPNPYSTPDNSHVSVGNAGYDSPYGTYAPPPLEHEEKHSRGIASSPAYSSSSYGSLKPPASHAAPTYDAPPHVSGKRIPYGAGAVNPSYGFAPGGMSPGSYGGAPYDPASNAAPTYSQTPPGGSAPAYASSSHSAAGGNRGTSSGTSYKPASYGAAPYSQPAPSSGPRYPSSSPYDKKPSPASQGLSYTTSGYGPATYAAGESQAHSHGAPQPYGQPSRNAPGYSDGHASGASYAPSYGAGGRDSAYPPVSYTQPARGSSTYAAAASPTPYAAARPQSSAHYVNAPAPNYEGSHNNAASYATTVAYSSNASPDTSYGMAPSYRSPSKATDESHGPSYSAQPSASHSAPAYGNKEAYTQQTPHEDSHSSQAYTTSSYGSMQYTTQGSTVPSYGVTHAPPAHSEPGYSQSAGQPPYSPSSGNTEHLGASYAPPSYTAPGYSPTNAPLYSASHAQPAYASAQNPSYSAAVTMAPSYADLVNSLSSPYYGVRPYSPTMSPPLYAAASYAPPAYAAPGYARPSYVVSYAPPANLAPPYHGAAASPSYTQQSYGPSYAPPVYAAPVYAQPPSYNQAPYAAPAYTGGTYAPPAYVAPAYGQPSYAPHEYSAPHYAPNAQPTYHNPTHASHAEKPSYSGAQYVHPAYNPSLYAASYAPHYDVQYAAAAYSAHAAHQPSYSAPSSYVVSHAPPSYSAPSYAQPAYNEQPHAPTYAPPTYSSKSHLKQAYKQPSYGAPVYAQPFYNQHAHQGMAPHAASHSGYGIAPTTHVRYPPEHLAAPSSQGPYAGNRQPLHPNYPQHSLTAAYSLPAYPVPSHYSPAAYSNSKPSHGAPAAPASGYGPEKTNYGPAPLHGLVYGAPQPHAGSHAALPYAQPPRYNAAESLRVTSAPPSYTAPYGATGASSGTSYRGASGLAGSYGQGASLQGAYTTASYPAATPAYGSAYTTSSGQSEYTTSSYSPSYTTNAAPSSQGTYTTDDYPTDTTYAPSYSQQSFTTHETPAGTTYSSASVYREPVYEHHGNTPAAYPGPTYAPPSYLAPSYSPPAYNAPSHSPPAYSAPAAADTTAGYSGATHVAPTFSAPSYSPPAYAPPSYNAPSHSPPAYSAPAAADTTAGYSGATHVAPSYSPPAYAPPSYNAPSHSPPVYSAPAAADTTAGYSVATHAAPAYSAPSYAPPGYAPPSYNAPSPQAYYGPAAADTTSTYSVATHATPAYSAPSYSPPPYEAPSHSESSYIPPSYFAPAAITTVAYSQATYSPSGYSPPQAYSGPTHSGPSYGPVAGVSPSYGRSAHTSAKVPPKYAPAKDVEAMYAQAHSIEGRYKPQCPQALIGCPVCTKKVPEELLKNICNYDLVAEGEVIHPPQPGRGYGGLCSDMCIGEVLHGGKNYNLMERIRFSLSKYCTCETTSKSFTKVIVFSYRHNWRAHGGSHGQLLLDDKTVVVPLSSDGTAAIKAAASKCLDKRYPMGGRAYSDAAYAGPAGCPDPFDESCPYCPSSVASEGLANDLCTSEYASVVAIGLDYRKMAEYKNGMFTWKQTYLPDIEVDEETGFGKNVSVTVKVNGTPAETTSNGEEASGGGLTDSCLTYTVKALYNVSGGSDPVPDSYDLQLFLGKQCPCQHLKSQLPGYAVLVVDKQAKLSGGAVLQLGSGVKLYPLPYGTLTLSPPCAASDQLVARRASEDGAQSLPPPELEIPVADDAQDAADEGPCPAGVQATCPVCLDASEEPASTVTHYCKSEYAAVVSIPDDAFTSSTDSAIQPWWAPKIGLSSSPYGSHAQVHVNVKPKARYQFPETDRTVGALDNSRKCRSGRLHVKQVIAPGNRAESTAAVKFTVMSSCKCAFLEHPTQFAVLASKRPPSGDEPLHLADDVALMALPLGKTEFPTCVRAEPKKKSSWKFW